MGIQYDLVAFATSTTGTGALSVGAALQGCRTPAGASIPDGTAVSYAISSAGGAARETGSGVIGAGGTTMTRSLRSSTTGSLLDLSGSSEVYLTCIAEDFVMTGLAYSVAMPGKFQLPQHLSYSTGTGQAVIANTAYICPLWCGRAQTVTRLGTRIATASAGTSVRVALYSDHPSLAKPNALLVDSGAMSSATTGDKESVVSAALSAGLYWVVVTSDGAPTVGAGTVNSAALGGSTSAQNIRGWTAPLTFGSYPADASGWTLTDYVSTNMPVGWVRVV